MRETIKQNAARRWNEIMKVADDSWELRDLILD